MPTGSSAASIVFGMAGASRPAEPRNISFRRVTTVIPQIFGVCLWTGRRSSLRCAGNASLEIIMANEKGPNIKKKQKCKNCEGKGLLKKGDKVVKCQRCKGTGVR